MFYLMEFFKMLIKYPLRAGAFFLLSALLLFSASAQMFWTYNFWGSSIDIENLPYFHALVSSKEDTSGIVRKLSVLPGIEKVEVLPDEQIKAQTRSVFETVDAKEMGSTLSISYVGFKVVFSRDAHERSQILIREYIQKLAGEGNAILSDVKFNKEMDAKKNHLVSLLEHGTPWLILGAIFLVWLAAFSSFSGKLRERAYLIEQYQRKKYVALKTILVIFILDLMISLSGVFVVSSPVVLNLVFVLVLLILAAGWQLRKYSWAA